MWYIHAIEYYSVIKKENKKRLLSSHKMMNFKYYLMLKQANLENPHTV